MSELFILQNQDKLFLGKQKDWLDGRDLGGLFKTVHKDEAINQMFEVSSKDYTQRVKVLSCRANEKGLPIIEPELLPPAQARTRQLFAETEQEQELAAVDVEDNAESLITSGESTDIRDTRSDDDQAVSDNQAVSDSPDTDIADRS